MPWTLFSTIVEEILPPLEGGEKSGSEFEPVPLCLNCRPSMSSEGIGVPVANSSCTVFHTSRKKQQQGMIDGTSARIPTVSFSSSPDLWIVQSYLFNSLRIVILHPERTWRMPRHGRIELRFILLMKQKQSKKWGHAGMIRDRNLFRSIYFMPRTVCFSPQ